MKRNKWEKLLILSIVLLLLTACFNKKEDIDKKEDKKKESEKQLSEEELQKGKGVNGDLPDIVYTYEGIVDAAPGIYQFPDTYEENIVKKSDIWRENVQNELKKIKPALGEDASDEEVERLFKKFLYIAGYDYEPIETLDRFSYVIFKDDMVNPFTKQKIEENMNVNLEIILDASGSMKQKIGDKTMMEIAKESIEKVISEMPANTKVGLRVFGHKGDNTASKKQESCSANELISPIETLNKDKLKNSLAPIQPTGWTSIAKSIENGTNDLKALKGEKTLNILYIITDGIETCDGNPVETAKKFKNENTDIVLGIIGFNVDAHQNKVLKEITNAANGYYSSANDAAKLTEELQRIHEIAFSDYKWEPLNDSMINRIIASHNLTLTMNKFLIERSLGEKNNMSSLIMYGSKSYSNDPKFAGLYEFNGKISKKLKALSEERREKIKTLYKTEFEKIEKQSQDYIAQIKARKGAIVAYIPTTSRKNPMSKYWSGHGGKGGTIKDSKKDNEELRKEQSGK